MQGLERQDLQEEQVEGALDEVVGFAHIGFLGEYAHLLSVSKGDMGVQYGEPAFRVSPQLRSVTDLSGRGAERFDSARPGGLRPSLP